MPVAIPLFGATDVVTAAELLDRIASLEAFLNEDIASSDLQDGSVKTRHLFRPEFCGSPAPRCHAVSKDLHWRTKGSDPVSRAHLHPEGGEDAYRCLPGLAATVKVPEDNVTVDITVSFYAFQFAGGGSVRNNQECGRFRLVVDGAGKGATMQRIFTNSPDENPWGRQQYHMVYQTVLDKGPHDIYVAGLVWHRGYGGADQNDWVHIFIDEGSAVIDVMVR